MEPDRSREGAARTTDPSPADIYRERAGRFDLEAAAQGRAARLCGRARLVLFTASIPVGWWLFAAGRNAAAWVVLAAAAALFGAFVARQRAARLRGRRAELMADFNREGLARIARSWSAMRPAADLAPPGDHDYADDLDLCGPASLLHLVGKCGTPPGWRTLLAWLLGRADPDTVALRQEAVREMAGALDFRDGLAAEGRLALEGPGSAGSTAATAGPGGASAAATARFLRWAEGDPWLPAHPWLRAASLALPPINVAAIVLWALGAAPIAAPAWALLASTAALAPRWRAIHRAFAEADDGESGVRRYGPLLGHLRDAPLESRRAVAIRDRIGAGTRTAPHEIATLRRLLDMADARRSPLLHVPLALVLHWDVHVLAGLERWRARSGSRVRGWLGAVGEAEALAALAALAADHPDWTMPSLERGAPTLRARNLGHPLLEPRKCVRNDVEIGPEGSFLLVTGSNMSGKSTLLRAVGLNAVLAQAGGPVCAEKLRLPELRVVTSIRVQDSLAEGVSYFMAGLRRLKRVVDAAEAEEAVAETGTAPRTLYLLDEILDGTNSAERRIAARTVLRRLLSTRAIGAATTHDLALADADDLTARAVHVHFAESVGVGGAALAFDYRLRDGIATSTNALRLLELAGLGAEPRHRSASRE